LGDVARNPDHAPTDTVLEINEPLLDVFAIDRLERWAHRLVDLCSHWDKPLLQTSPGNRLSVMVYCTRIPPFLAGHRRRLTRRRSMRSLPPGPSR
jgi:hypothetical protein